ncbi:MAG: hypothetical protein WCQ99_13150 [Pseudomonadota bacterium]
MKTACEGIYDGEKIAYHGKSKVMILFLDDDTADNVQAGQKAFLDTFGSWKDIRTANEML